MRVLIATDAWSPQVNGVVFALKNLAAHAGEQGLDIAFLTPDGFRSVPMPTYPEIRLALATPRTIERRLHTMRFDHVHIATEGPIGVATRSLCRKRRWSFTTSYHTKFPEYVHARCGIPASWTYAWLRRFHGAAICTMVATRSLRDELQAEGFEKLAFWSRGVDHAIFHPAGRDAFPFPRPIFLYVGRVAVEKNIDAFLSLNLPGTKVVVGDGPARERLANMYPDAVFLGARKQTELASFYSSADVFVFPSKTDTFGMVLIEALACGLPVASFPVPGPLDVLANGKGGVLDTDLRTACLEALAVPRDAAQAHAMRFTWQASAKQFADNIRAARAGRLATASRPDLHADRAHPEGVSPSR